MNTIGYRLFIDVPLGNDLDIAKNIADQLVAIMENEFDVNDALSVVQYKLSHDTDRANKNYLDINENGHASSKKMKIVLKNSPLLEKEGSYEN